MAPLWGSSRAKGPRDPPSMAEVPQLFKGKRYNLPPMRVALIDLGTNAARFDVVDVGPGGAAARVHRERLAVRLGEGVFQSGRLSRAAMGRTLAAFESFRKTCRDLSVDRVTAFGTSALRDSANSDVFLAQLK